MAFIVFEGIDHVGKSTLINTLSKELKSLGLNFIVTREPGGTPLGEQIRKLVLYCASGPLSPETEALLISAARRDHIEKVIRPALKKGQWVLCDRFWPSTSAFQGGGRGLPAKNITWLNNWTVDQDIVPDLFVLLDMPVELAEKRRDSTNSKKGDKKALLDRFEGQKRDFHQRVREGYLSLAKRNIMHPSQDFLYNPKNNGAKDNVAKNKMDTHKKTPQVKGWLVLSACLSPMELVQKTLKEWKARKWLP